MQPYKQNPTNLTKCTKIPSNRMRKKVKLQRNQINPNQSHESKMWSASSDNNYNLKQILHKCGDLIDSIMLKSREF